MGVFTDEEVADLSEEDKAILKAHIVHQIQTSPHIRQIIHNNPKYVTNDPDARTILRREAGALRERLKKK